jgi:hypothetical protein
MAIWIADEVNKKGAPKKESIPLRNQRVCNQKDANNAAAKSNAMYKSISPKRHK